MTVLPSQSHQVLARKWRPRDFESLVGQDIVVRALRHALDNNRLHHAYLLTGTRGVGKTTIARILAKALNCESGITSRPCGTCNSCKGVDEGRFPDYIEMDAASNRKVEEMTVVLENAAYSPSVGRFKVLVIDEVHMLTNHAFNAMLKTLEEPPAHVVFVLATTDPQKVPVTVLSRCMQFGLRNLRSAEVAGHLAHVLEAEQISFEPPALDLLGRAAAGSMRDALSLVDQAIALGGGSVALAPVREMLGAVDGQVITQLLTLLAGEHPAAVITLADEMALSNLPFGQILMALARELQRIAVVQLDPALDVAAPADGADAGAIGQMAELLSPEDVQVWYQVAIHAARDLPLAPDPQTGFVMALVRMLAFRAGAAASRPAEAGQPPVARVPLQAARAPRGQATSRVIEQAAAPAASAASADAVATRPASSGAGEIRVEGNWSELVAQVPSGGMSRQLLQQSELVSIDGNLLTLRVPLKPMTESALVERVAGILTKWFETPVRLAVVLGATGDSTAAAKASEVRQQRQSAAAESIHSDPFVRELIDGFGATIMPDSIKPLEGDAG